MKESLKKFITKSERGQAIVLVAFAFIGLVAMVGLVTDTGILLIEYGKLKRSVDAAAIGAAQQYRAEPVTGNLNEEGIENAAINFLNLNQTNNLVSVTVNTCASVIKPDLCNPDPITNPIDNRKLVEVTATSNVRFGFLRVLGFDSATLSATSVGEAATVDLVLIIDTSSSMAYETGVETNCPVTCYDDEADDDPSACNIADNCQPMRAVKDVALDFIETLYFPYDRVAVIAMTSQTSGGNRYPVEVIPLTSDKADVSAAINNISVFEPRVCDNTETEGACLSYSSGTFTGALCQIFELQLNRNEPLASPSSCPSSNVGGTLRLAREALTGSGDTDNQRLDAFWVTVALLGSTANATDVTDPTDYPTGFCPANTWLGVAYGQGRTCRDSYPSTRHYDTDSLFAYVNPLNNVTYNISLYDAEDYAKDMADALATLTTGNGVTIYTIGLGTPIQSVARDGYGNVLANEPPPAEDLLEYIAECAGEGVAGNDDCDSLTSFDINHGQYFYAPDRAALSDIFDRIAKNIATKISQ
jgi:hypothetical protein